MSTLPLGAARPDPPAAPPRRNRARRRVVARVGLVVAGVVVLIGLVGLFPNEPIRRSIESRMNRSLRGYSVRIGRARLQPLGGSLSLEDVVLRQTAHPDPPILSLPLLRASIHWRDLLFLRLVADFRLDRPRIYANLAQLHAEASDAVPVGEKGWQQAVEAIYPLKINQLRVGDASITYVDADSRRPLELTHLDLKAANIRNVHSRDRTYPSSIQARAVVFGAGRATLDGAADFLAEPYAGVKGRFRLESVPLDALGPVGKHWNLIVSGGTLSASGEIEYSPRIRSLRMPEIAIDRVDLGYERGGPPRGDAVSASSKTRETPPWSLAVDRFRMTDSRLELVDRSRSPGYRLSVSHLRADVDGLATEPPGRTAHAVVRGKFMDQGDVQANASFQPRPRGGDLRIRLQVGPTDMTRLNDLFRSYGKFDVAAGTFQLFSEARVHDAYMTGYVKPIFRGVEVYDAAQDAKKGFFKKIYEGAIDVASRILKNQKHDQIATDASIDGPVGNTRSSLFEILGGVLENAFVRAILPGFDRQVGVERR